MNGDIKFLVFMLCFLAVVASVTYGLGIINQGLKDSRCHNASVISAFQIFNGTNTKDLYDSADHYIAYNGTTVAQLAKNGWYLVKVAPDSVGSPYPLLGLRFETLRVCK